MVILAAAKVGGIQANDSYPADFLLENLKIQTHVIETAWRWGEAVVVSGQQLHLSQVCRTTDQGGVFLTGSARAHE